MNKTIEILIAGDVHLGGGRIKNYTVRQSTNELFEGLIEEISEADVSVANLESPLIDHGEPILKTGPNLKSPVESLSLLKNAGFNLVTLANNHIMDYGSLGLRSTLKACSDAGIDTVGAGDNIEEAQRPLIKKINGTRVGIINIAENEFGTTDGSSPGAHPLNPIQNYYSIKEASENVDHVFVIVHGGHEGYPLPSPRMKETYRFFIDAGAKAVVGHHPHCYSGYEIYKGAPVFYSLGNFIFDKKVSKHSGWYDGFMVKFSIGDEINFDIIPFSQNSDRVEVRKLKGDKYIEFEKNIDRLNNIILNDDSLKEEFQKYCELTNNRYRAYLEPYSNKYIHGLRNRGMFPSMLSNKKKRLLLNLIRCESHQEVIKNILKS